MLALTADAATGLVRVASDVRRTWDDPLDVMEGLENILLTEYESAEGLLANFFRPSRASRLGLEDFPHAAADAELAVKLMAGALAGQTEGVNVLLHGAPGTGKTLLAKAIAGEADAAARKGDLMPRNAIGELLRSIGDLPAERQDTTEPTGGDRDSRVGQRLDQASYVLLADLLHVLDVFGVCLKGPASVHRHAIPPYLLGLAGIHPVLQAAV